MLWAKIYRIQDGLYKFQADIFQDDTLDGTISIAKQVKSKKFFFAYRAKRWVEKYMYQKQSCFFVKEQDIRSNWND